MGLEDEPPYKQRACSESEHKIVLDENEFRVCEHCGLSIQTLVDDLGHDF